MKPTQSASPSPCWRSPPLRPRPRCRPPRRPATAICARWKGRDGSSRPPAARAIDIEANYPVLAGDLLEVDPGGRLELSLPDFNVVRLAGGSELELARLALSAETQDVDTALRLLRGELQFLVHDLLPVAERPRVDTANATIYLQGTRRLPDRHRRLRLDRGGRPPGLCRGRHRGRLERRPRRRAGLGRGWPLAAGRHRARRRSRRARALGRGARRRAGRLRRAADRRPPGLLRRAAVAPRQLGDRGRLPRLAPHRGGELAPLRVGLLGRLADRHGLDLGRALGLGDLPLRLLGALAALRLGLAARPPVRARLGLLVLGAELCRLGAGGLLLELLRPLRPRLPLRRPRLGGRQLGLLRRLDFLLDPQLPPARPAAPCAPRRPPGAGHPQLRARARPDHHRQPARSAPAGGAARPARAAPAATRCPTSPPSWRGGGTCRARSPSGSSAIGGRWPAKRSGSARKTRGLPPSVPALRWPAPAGRATRRPPIPGSPIPESPTPGPPRRGRAPRPPRRRCPAPAPARPSTPWRRQSGRLRNGASPAEPSAAPRARPGDPASPAADTPAANPRGWWENRPNRAAPRGATPTGPAPRDAQARPGDPRAAGEARPPWSAASGRASATASGRRPPVPGSAPTAAAPRRPVVDRAAPPQRPTPGARAGSETPRRAPEAGPRAAPSRRPPAAKPRSEPPRRQPAAQGRSQASQRSSTARRSSPPPRKSSASGSSRGGSGRKAASSGSRSRQLLARQGRPPPATRLAKPACGTPVGEQLESAAPHDGARSHRVFLHPLLCGGGHAAGHAALEPLLGEAGARACRWSSCSWAPCGPGCGARSPASACSTSSGARTTSTPGWSPAGAPAASLSLSD